MSSRSTCRAPLRSNPIMFFTPKSCIILVHAVPAAPTPATMTLRAFAFLFTCFRALMRAAVMTTAVPCWSSWKMGMSSSSCRRCSISKQRGAEMSSRFTPPKVGATALTNWMISSVSFVLIHRGKASTPPNSLNSMALPSMTGMAASGPMSPSPSTAVPSDTIATVFFLMVSLWARSTFS